MPLSVFDSNGIAFFGQHLYIHPFFSKINWYSYIYLEIERIYLFTLFAFQYKLAMEPIYIRIRLFLVGRWWGQPNKSFIERCDPPTAARLNLAQREWCCALTAGWRPLSDDAAADSLECISTQLEYHHLSTTTTKATFPPQSNVTSLCSNFPRGGI